MAPSIEGTVHTFQENGLYDGLFLMKDDETDTYWDHMTGEAVYGPLTGHQLDVATLRQTRVDQILDESPDALVALSDRILWEDERLGLDGLLASMGSKLSRLFSQTVKQEDDRRPTMDLGMGLWQGETSRYYPYETVAEAGNAILDEFAGRDVLVYLDPTAYSLSAFYVTAGNFTWDEKVLRLSDGSYVEGGVMYDANGERATAGRPLQVFTRWYGFSLTFPDTEIFGTN